MAPSYVDLFESGELAARAARARDLMHSCVLCARRCRVDRTVSLKGVMCRTGVRARVEGYGAHHGEEDPIRGTRGSGAIFFSGCSLRCVFCQNWDVSQGDPGLERDADTLAGMMLELQASGCHNVNLVTPSHVVAQILDALVVAAGRGLRIPLVWNSGGYDSLEALRLLDGVVDIYMPDIKWGESGEGLRFSRARQYAPISRAAVREMYRQVGDLETNADGVAVRGLLVRHLVLPGGVARTERVLRFIAEELSPDTYVNLMDQYRPAFRAPDYPPLDRALAEGEFEAVVARARRLGLRRVDVRRSGVTRVEKRC